MDAHSSQIPSSPPSIDQSHATILLETLAKIRSNGKRKKCYSSDGVMGPYIKAARWFPLSIDPFVDLRAVIFDGMEADFKRAREGEEEEIPNPQETQKQRAQRERHIQLYGQFKALVPGFNNIVFKFEDNPDLLHKFADTIAEHASSARSEDIYSLRTRGIFHILDDPERGSFDPPIPPHGAKSLRGFHHKDTARLLCPQHFLPEFDKHPQDFMDDVNNGHIKLMSSEFPSFLYDQETQYDPDAREVGLLRGRLLVRVYRHIFTGPGTAITGKGGKTVKGCKAKIHRVSAVTPQTIAYAAMMARFMMSSVEQWTKHDGTFNLQRFYDYILYLFDPEEGMDNEWIAETIAWWKRQVPGLGGDVGADEDASDGEDLRNDFMAIRRAAMRRRYGIEEDQEDEDGQEDLDAEDENNTHLGRSPSQRPRSARPAVPPQPTCTIHTSHPDPTLTPASQSLPSQLRDITRQEQVLGNRDHTRSPTLTEMYEDGPLIAKVAPSIKSRKPQRSKEPASAVGPNRQSSTPNSPRRSLSSLTASPPQPQQKPTSKTRGGNKRITRKAPASKARK